jgi:hypothetical protein
MLVLTHAGTDCSACVATVALPAGGVEVVARTVLIHIGGLMRVVLPVLEMVRTVLTVIGTDDM